MSTTLRFTPCADRLRSPTSAKKSTSNIPDQILLKTVDSFYEATNLSLDVVDQESSLKPQITLKQR